MIYRFRIILDTEEDVFRDIEIEQEATLEQFHNVITQSFGFDGAEMASFYVSDSQWNQGEEISLFDMSDGNQPIRLMNETSLDDVANEDSPKLIYIYDFLNMWTFLVELAEVVEYENGREYPNVMYIHGQLPDHAPDQEFIVDDLGEEEGKNEYLESYDDYDTMGFEENWN
ncbi:IS1096 element passenger TnpR family protein [Aquimarina pacifica]|uniref:IS1096 element passenger TnpR family protein n=1 Tax=Aquimarina pacifica TaxID=1296415 RepID=UPI000471AF70|nr:hypothetical protein [Aquimarina pacifica]